MASGAAIDYAGIIQAVGTVAGGVIEESGAAAAEADPDNVHAKRTVEAGGAIRRIFSGIGGSTAQERPTKESKELAARKAKLEQEEVAVKEEELAEQRRQITEGRTRANFQLRRTSQASSVPEERVDDDAPVQNRETPTRMLVARQVLRSVGWSEDQAERLLAGPPARPDTKVALATLLRELGWSGGELKRILAGPPEGETEPPLERLVHIRRATEAA